MSSEPFSPGPFPPGNDSRNPIPQNPYQGVPMAEVASNAPPGRLKASTKTFAIVLMVLGILGVGNAIMTPLFAMIAQFAMDAAGEKDEELNAFADQLRLVFHPANVTLMAVSFFVGLAMLVGAIATLLRRRWGAQVLKTMSALMILVTIGQTVFGLYMQVLNKDAAMKQFEDQFNRPGAPQAPEGLEGFGQIMLMVQMFFTVVFGLIFMAVYAWAWLHFSSSSTMAQFDTQESSTGRSP